MNLIPLASLAVVLIVVGYKLANPKLFKQLSQQGYEQLIPFLATIAGILFTDLLTGVLIGLGIAMLIILRSNYLSSFYAVPDLSNPEQGLRIQLAEDMSFLTRANLVHMLGTLPDGLEIILDASQTRRMHPDIREVIDDFLINAETRKIKVEFVDMPEDVIVDHVTYIYNQTNGRTPVLSH
jgi:MFS superfamily sulfate permease-like transporter